LIFAADFQPASAKILFMDSVGYEVEAKPGMAEANAAIRRCADSDECTETGKSARIVLGETLDVRFPAKILKLTPGETVHISAAGHSLHCFC